VLKPIKAMAVFHRSAVHPPVPAIAKPITTGSSSSAHALDSEDVTIAGRGCLGILVGVGLDRDWGFRLSLPSKRLADQLMQGGTVTPVDGIGIY
jgi:hypothetical protein